MIESEKKILIKFSLLYILSTTLFIGSVLFLFYSYIETGATQTLFIGQYLQADLIGLDNGADDLNVQNLGEVAFDIFLITFFIILFVGYFFGKFFTTHSQSSFHSINDFIRDATHELNTPISTILMNIELLENKKDFCDRKELKRISIASRTLNRLYDDLTYIQLNHKHFRDIEHVNLSLLIKERLVYFGAMFKSKRVKLIDSIDEDVFCELDKNDAIRLIDNLISNSIKYNKRGGEVSISLCGKNFSVKDSGIGMSPQQLKNIFYQFKRYNKSEGGFGIGLSVVKNVVDFYGFNITMESTLLKGTLATIIFDSNKN